MEPSKDKNDNVIAGLTFDTYFGQEAVFCPLPLSCLCVANLQAEPYFGTCRALMADLSRRKKNENL